MKQYLKLVIWPRGKYPAKSDKQKKINYRYSLIGMLVTDEPISEFENENELVLDGPVNELVVSLVTIKKRKPKIKVGDARDVLLNLNNI